MIHFLLTILYIFCIIYLMINKDGKQIIEYTKEEFIPIFNTIKKCIKSNEYIIELNENRSDNQEFIIKYNLKEKRIKKILSDIKIEDFCYATPHNDNPNVVLYVFAPNATVYEIEDAKVTIQMYIKFRLCGNKDSATTIVISFHELKRSISYSFK